MKHNILISIKSVYGNELIYPECPISEAFCKLLGTKTIPPDKLHIIATELGYGIDITNSLGQLASKLKSSPRGC